MLSKQPQRFHCRNRPVQIFLGWEAMKAARAKAPGCLPTSVLETVPLSVQRRECFVNIARDSPDEPRTDVDGRCFLNWLEARLPRGGLRPCTRFVYSKEAQYCNASAGWRRSLISIQARVAPVKHTSAGSRPLPISCCLR
jgi:hypothetical protein